MIKLCETCFKQGNYPSSLKKEDFAQNHLAQEHWTRLEKDLGKFNEQDPSLKQSSLAFDKKQKLMQLAQ